MADQLAIAMKVTPATKSVVTFWAVAPRVVIAAPTSVAEVFVSHFNAIQHTYPIIFLFLCATQNYFFDHVLLMQQQEPFFWKLVAVFTGQPQ